MISLAAQGMTNVEISRVMGCSAETTKSRWKLVFLKLGVRNRTQAVAVAFREAWVA